MSDSLQQALMSASMDLYQSYQKSLASAMESWLPAIGVKNDSQNGYPHIKNIEKHLDSILFGYESRSIHDFELSAIELYVLLMSVLLHDIGKQKENSLRGNARQKHSFFSYDIIVDNWAELGIVSKQIADVIALISFSHDYSKDNDSAIARAADVEKRLNNYIKTEHSGIIRAKALAALLFLGDHMDGSLSRAVPQIVTGKPGIVGAFRNEVQSVYFDLKNKMLCTSINARLLRDVKDAGPENKDAYADAEFLLEKEYEESELVKDDIKEGRPVPVLDKGSDISLMELINIKKARKGALQCKIINTLIRDVEKNNKEIKYIRKPLYEIGMSVLGWFLECNGMLFSVEKTNDSGEFQYFKLLPAFEPILTEEYLTTIFRGMVEISGSSLGDNYYDYETLLNYSREHISNMHKVKCAVNRLAIKHDSFYIADESKSKVVFYCDADSWSLKINANDVNEQKTQLQKSYEKIFPISTDPAGQPGDAPKAKKPAGDGECRMISYDADNSIIFSNPLDYLLCRDLQRYSSPAEERLKISKYQIAKLLKSDCTSVISCDECRYLNEIFHEEGSVGYLGGLLLSNERKAAGSGGNDIKKMLGERRFEHGTGNIVIAGSYGTGKSTLSFQMASACANNINQGISVYYSLESTRHDIVENYIFRKSDIEKESDYNDIEKKINYLEWYPNDSEDDDKKDSEHLYKHLKEALSAGRCGNVPPQMLFPKLTPKNMVDASSPDYNKTALFEKRFQEIKYMLAAICAYNAKKGIDDARVKMVVIDSLNAFADRPLLREEVHRLFDLFTTYHMLGIFTMEESVQEDFVGTNYNDSIQYRADGVILLRNTNSQSHHESYLEIRKMRNQQHVLGEQLYKIRSQKYKPRIGNMMNREVEIYPSLHYLISATERIEETKDLHPYQGALPIREDGQENQDSQNGQNGQSGQSGQSGQNSHNIFYIKNFDYILPESIINRGAKKDDGCMIPSSQVITITGPSGFYKSDLAINALFAGMVMENENSLLIRLNDRDLFEEDGFRLSKELFDNLAIMKPERDGGDSQKYFEITRDEGIDAGNRNTSIYKTRSKTWRMDVKKLNSQSTRCAQCAQNTQSVKNPQSVQRTLTELVFTSGALKPEEFIDTVLEEIHKKSIKRVALVDLKTIGISYPFLIQSETSGTMFIPAFIHLMRNHKIHLIMSTSTSLVKDSASEIYKACELSDALITIKQNKNSSQVTFIESSGNKVRDKKYYIEQDKGSLYYCRINHKAGDLHPACTPLLAPFELRPI